VKYWEIIIENLRNAGWNCGSMTTTDGKGRSIWVVAAERSDAGRFIVHVDQELPAFLELEPQSKPTGIIMTAIARNRMKNWEIIADNLSKAGWSWGCASAIDSNGRTISMQTHIAATESVSLCVRGEKLTAFVELEAAIRSSSESS
jgi:hypothetical protein